MIIKFFKSNNNPKATLDYLVGKNRDREYAKLLKGNIDLSLKITESIGFSNKYTTGCLSFEENNLPEEQKKEIIEHFESAFLAGLEKEQYNITWIEHRDKDRLELNFFIPNVELTTKKRLQPYYDKADRPLAENFKQVINHEYGLSDPNAPEKKQTLITRHDLPKDKKEALHAINDGLMVLAQAGKITNRYDVITTLKNNGFEIARTTLKNISIKTDGKNLRLKGAFYEEDFRFSKELSADIGSRSAEYKRSCQERYQTARERLDRATDQRKREYSGKYTSPTIDIKPSINDKNFLVADHTKHTNINGTIISKYLDSVVRKEPISRSTRLESISRDLQSPSPQNENNQLSVANRQNQTVHSGRSEVYQSELGQESKNHRGTVSNDANDTAIRERIKRIIETARGHAQLLIAKIRSIGTRERLDQTAIQSNYGTIEELKQHTLEIKEIVQQRKQPERNQGMSR